MTSSLSLLTSADLRQLAGALRSGRVGTPYTALSIRRHVPDGLAEAIAADLGRMDQRGMKPEFLANTIDLIVQDRSSRPLADDLIDLVWTGPEAAGTMNRDTAVVVRELFPSRPGNRSSWPDTPSIRDGSSSGRWPSGWRRCRRSA